MIVLNSNVEVLSNVLDFTVCHIIILVVIIVIVGDIVDDIGSVTSLTAGLGSIIFTLSLAFIRYLGCFLDEFALWVNSSSFNPEALS